MRPSTDGPRLFDRPGLISLLDRLYPRFLAQIDRDPDSPTYGSADRGFWMYRLHDFDSGVLQQAGLTLACLVRLAEKGDLDGARHARPEHAPYWRELARAVNERTVTRLAGRGRLDEYYPGEQSLPGTVFACYAALKSALLLEQQEILRAPGLEHAALEMLQLRPSPAANQDTAAAAFLALYARARAWREHDAQATVSRLVGDGRFEEYGGLDVGYATVTLNYLAAMHDDGSHPTEGAVRALSSLLADFVGPAGNLGGEYASRSTTYFLPFGFTIAADVEPSLASSLAALDVGRIFEKLDDRYLMHYCLPSLGLATLKLTTMDPPIVATRTQRDRGPWRRKDHRALGVYVCRRADVAVFIGLDKGGVVQIDGPNRTDIDAGYRLRRGDAVYASGVLAPAFEGSVEETETTTTIRVRIGFRRYRPLVAGPVKTVALRTLWFGGRRLNAYFKKRLIADAEVLDGRTLDRTIRIDLEAMTVEIEDRFEGLTAGDELTPAPPSPLRLVPSARFHQPGEEVAALQRIRAGTLDNPQRRRFSLATTDPG
jgi:hypothetical protein